MVSIAKVYQIRHGFITLPNLNNEILQPSIDHLSYQELRPLLLRKMMGVDHLYEKKVCPLGNQMERAFPLKIFRKNWGYFSRLVFTRKIRKLLNHFLSLSPSSLMKYAVAPGGKWSGTVLCTGKFFGAQTPHFVCW